MKLVTARTVGERRMGQASERARRPEASPTNIARSRGRETQISLAQATG